MPSRPIRRVFTISIHEAGRWPGTGQAGDRRQGRARNLPVPQGVNDSEFTMLIEEAVLPLARRFAPDAVVITAGADPLAGDPLSKMMLSNGALWDAAMAVAATAPAAVVLGGGGYNPWTRGPVLGRAVGAHRRQSQFPRPCRKRRAPCSKRCPAIWSRTRTSIPTWLISLVDPRNDGVIRPEIVALRDEVLAP